MASTIAWLDHSEAQRRQMLEVVSLFQEKGTVDDLGFGPVRDAVSDLLFPGMSVLHTRAAYLLFVPWIYRSLERERVRADRVAGRARQDELALTYALLDGGETEGVIGRAAREGLKRLASNIYWNAFGRFGIRRFAATQEQYHRSFARLRRNRPMMTDDGEPVSGGAASWDPSLPPSRDGLLESTTFALDTSEARYLRDRICTTCEATFLAHLVSRPQDRADHVQFPWAHPARASASPVVQEHLEHARNFSEVAHGAQLGYNLLAAERRAADGLGQTGHDLVARYRERLDRWAQTVEERRAEHDAWDRSRFWDVVGGANPRVPFATRRFVGWWIDQALSDPETVLDRPQVRSRLVERERALKGAYARLTHRRPLERWSGASGVDQLAFRWGSVQDVVNDVTEGLAGR